MSRNSLPDLSPEISGRSQLLAPEIDSRA